MSRSPRSPQISGKRTLQPCKRMVAVGSLGLVFLSSGLVVHSLAETEVVVRKSFATSDMQHVAENAKNAMNGRFLAASSSTSDDMQDLLDLHNEARCEHNADPLVYSTTVEATAQAYAEELALNYCGILQHSNGEDRNYYGEILLTCWSTVAGCFSPTYAMSLLYDSEVQASNVEDYGGHATQILWKSTTELGCAVESCISGSFKYDVLVCHYNPAGNIGGQYLDEVELPSGASC